MLFSENYTKKHIYYSKYTYKKVYNEILIKIFFNWQT